MEVHASLRAEDIFLLGPVAITNSMVMSWITVIVLATVGIAAGRNPQLVPHGVQNFFEAIVEALMGFVEGSAGHYARRAFPLIATLFIYILSANWFSLFPGVGTIFVPNPHVHAAEGSTSHASPVRVAEAAPPAAEASTQRQGTESAGEKHELARVPLLRAANADLNMTLGMGLISFFFIHGSGMAVHGVWGYIRNDIFKPVLIGPIKLVIEMFIPVSLSMRLFGNIFGGEMLLTVMGFPLVAVAFLFAEMFFGFIQAIIFSILTLIFTSVAAYVPPGHGPGEHGEEGGDGHGHGAGTPHGGDDLGVGMRHTRDTAAPAHA